MFNLLKSDMYRLVHGKMLWVVTAIVVVASVLVVAMMHVVSSPEFLSMTASAVDMTVTACEDEGARGAASGDETEGPAAPAASVAAAAEAVEDVAENAAEAEKDAASGSASAELWASVAEDPPGPERGRFRGRVPGDAHLHHACGHVG